MNYDDKYINSNRFRVMPESRRRQYQPWDDMTADDQDDYILRKDVFHEYANLTRHALDKNLGKGNIRWTYYGNILLYRLDIVTCLEVTANNITNAGKPQNTTVKLTEETRDLLMAKANKLKLTASEVIKIALDAMTYANTRDKLAHLDMMRDKVLASQEQNAKYLMKLSARAALIRKAHRL